MAVEDNREDMDPLAKELLSLICSTCHLLDVDQASIPMDAPLIGPESPLGSDSLDALEIAITVQQKYGVRMDSENTTRVVLQSLATLTEYVRAGTNVSVASHGSFT